MRVLIIDDNEDVTEAISDYLESIGDSCTCLNDGKQGLEVIKLFRQITPPITN